MVNKTSEITIKVTTDENQVPEQITWTASDTDVKDKNSKAMMVALWDEDEANTLRMDLWTKTMTVDEMKQFTHQTFVTMTDTFEKATGENQMALAMRDFCEFFGEKMNILAPKEGDTNQSSS